MKIEKSVDPAVLMCRASRALVSLGLSLLLGCAAVRASHHFYDPQGDSLEKHDAVWNALSEFFGDACPVRIVIHIADGATSMNHPERNAVTLTPADYENNFVTILAHESSHLCMFNLTDGASNQEEFRFFDEGYASVVGAQVAGNLGSYRKRSLAVAAHRNRESGITFDRIQDWSTYFGAPPHVDHDAYGVGAAFIFYVQDTYGSEKLKSFFHSVGTTRDLGRAFQLIFGKSRAGIQEEWQHYLSGQSLPSPPRIVRMFPTMGADDVPPDVKEIFVEFSLPMENRISVGTRCDDGLCYKNAYWKTAMILAIRVDGRLLEAHTYRLTIGTHKGGELASEEGMPFPVTDWTFRTK